MMPSIQPSLAASGQASFHVAVRAETEIAESCPRPSAFRPTGGSDRPTRSMLRSRAQSTDRYSRSAVDQESDPAVCSSHSGCGGPIWSPRKTSRRVCGKRLKNLPIPCSLPCRTVTIGGVPVRHSPPQGLFQHEMIVGDVEHSAQRQNGYRSAGFAERPGRNLLEIGRRLCRPISADK